MGWTEFQEEKVMRRIKTALKTKGTPPMTDTEILNWLDEQFVIEVMFENGKTIDVCASGHDIRNAVIKARDNQNEAAGMRHYEGLRG